MKRKHDNNNNIAIHPNKRFRIAELKEVDVYEKDKKQQALISDMLDTGNEVSNLFYSKEHTITVLNSVFEKYTAFALSYFESTGNDKYIYSRNQKDQSLVQM
jgi:hypothetical protein